MNFVYHRAARISDSFIEPGDPAGMRSPMGYAMGNQMGV